MQRYHISNGLFECIAGVMLFMVLELMQLVVIMSLVRLMLPDQRLAERTRAGDCRGTG